MHSIAGIAVFHQCFVAKFIKLQQKALSLTAYFITFISISCAAIASDAAPAYPDGGFKQGNLQVQTRDGLVPLSVEIAQSREQLAYGLMHRVSFPEDYAMLFVFPDEGMHRMWMKNTPSPLDMLFIDKHGTITYIHPSAEPYSLNTIRSPMPVRAIMEMPGGSAKAKHINVGDTIIYHVFSPK
jgi:uncharacterized protein